MTEETTTPVDQTPVDQAPVEEETTVEETTVAEAPAAVEEETTVEEPAQEQPRLNLNDLAILVQAVDIGSQAGAYKGNDLEAIGAARNRVAGFVNINSPAPTAPETSE